MIRDAPALRDVIRGTIERLSVGTSTAALSELHKKFRDSREKGELSSSHINGLKYRLKRFVSYFPEEEAAGNINTEAIERALSSMRAGGLTAQTVKGIRGAAHAMFEWGVDRGLVGSNPVSRSKAPKVTQGEVGTITASQLKGLLRTALKTNPQMVPALATWAFTGVRRAELCRLRYDDFDHARKPPVASALKAKKDALMKGERAPSRVFRIEQIPDGIFSRVAVNPESQRRRSAKAWEAKSEVAILPHLPEATKIEDYQLQLWLGLRAFVSITRERLPLPRETIEQTLKLWRANLGETALTPTTAAHRVNQSMVAWLETCSRTNSPALVPSQELLWTLVGFPARLVLPN